MEKTTNSKAGKIIYWLTTSILALFILPGIFFMNSPMAIEGTKHLGLPEWFRIEVGIGQFIGGLILIIPMFGKRIKEWAYVALGIVYISAFIAHVAIGDPLAEIISAMVIFGILITSYITYNKNIKQ